MKFQRQAKILELIDRFEIETQEELTDHLRAVGYSTTQATSRSCGSSNHFPLRPESINIRLRRLVQRIASRLVCGIFSVSA